MSKFTACRNKGFAMEFDNGYSISVQWGPENYCHTKDNGAYLQPQKQHRWDSASAEIAVYGSNGSMIPIGRGDTVEGWLSTDQVAKVISICSSATPDLDSVIEIEIRGVLGTLDYVNDEE